MPTITHELWVCVDCMLIHANGECDERSPDQPEPWALWVGQTHLLAMGGTHADECPNGPDGPRNTDCDCETKEFDRSSCDGCGSTLHGTRHAFVVFNE